MLFYMARRGVCWALFDVIQVDTAADLRGVRPGARSGDIAVSRLVSSKRTFNNASVVLAVLRRFERGYEHGGDTRGLG
jgi:hypothetical protein